MKTTEIFNQIEKDILRWLEKESKIKFDNIKNFLDFISEVDIKTVLKNKEESGKHTIELYIENISSYSNFISRLLDFELYINTKYGISQIKRIKNNIKKSLLDLNKSYPNDFVSKRELNRILKKYDFIIMMILIQSILHNFSDTSIGVAKS